MTNRMDSAFGPKADRKPTTVSRNCEPHDRLDSGIKNPPQSAGAELDLEGTYILLPLFIPLFIMPLLFIIPLLFIPWSMPLFIIR